MGIIQGLMWIIGIHMALLADIQVILKTIIHLGLGLGRYPQNSGESNGK